MEINDELIRQWEPKIHKMLQTTYVVGYDREDLAQELRISIMKAAKAYKEDRGSIFHTYLHTTMVNTIRTSDFLPNHIAKAIGYEEEWELLELKDELSRFNLSDREKRFVELRLEGWTMDEISVDISKSAYRVRQNLRIKIEKIFYGQENEEKESL